MPSREKSWVLLRGLARETAHWGDFVGLMEKEYPQDQIICLDLPGTGEYLDVKSPLSVRGIVKFLSKELEKKGPKYPIHFVAVSLGGMVALEWMRQQPMGVHGGVVINTSIQNLNPFYHRLRWESYTSFFTKTIFLKGVARERAILDVISNRHDIHKSIAQEWAEIGEKRPIDPKNVGRQLLAASRFKLEEKVVPPCLLLLGMGDHLVSPVCSEQLHSQFGYPIERHPWGGHDLMLDDGPWVVDKINNFIATL